MTVPIISQLSAHSTCSVHVHVVVTHRAPLAVDLHLDAALRRPGAPAQTDTPCTGRGTGSRQRTVRRTPPAQGGGQGQGKGRSDGHPLHRGGGGRGEEDRFKERDDQTDTPCTGEGDMFKAKDGQMDTPCTGRGTGSRQRTVRRTPPAQEGGGGRGTGSRQGTVRRTPPAQGGGQGQGKGW